MESTFNNVNFSKNIKDYNTPGEGAEISAAMLIHWVDYYKNYKGNDINTALWKAQVSYCGGESNAAYQLGMANDFYEQDNGKNLFDEGKCANVVNNLPNYGVYRDSNNTQVATVTIYNDKTSVKK